MVTTVYVVSKFAKEDVVEIEATKTRLIKGQCRATPSSRIERRTCTRVSLHISEPAWDAWRLHTLEVRMEHDRYEPFPEALSA